MTKIQLGEWIQEYNYLHVSFYSINLELPDSSIPLEVHGLWKTTEQVHIKQ